MSKLIRLLLIIQMLSGFIFEEMCKDVTELGEKSCSDFPTSSSDKVCIDSEESDKPCKEMLSCNYAESGAEEVTNDICIKHPISKQNINTHICLADGSKCSEKHLCESEPASDEEIDCSSFTVKYENINTHKCVTNTNGNTPCKEEEIINTVLTTSPFSSSFISTIIEAQTTFISHISSEFSLKSTETAEINTTEGVVVIDTTNGVVIDTTERIVINTTEGIVIKVPTTITEEIEETFVILIGFSRFVKQINSFSFMVHFVPIKNYLYSKYLMFPLIITYYTSLRGLKEQYTNCTLTNSQSMISYICEVQAQTSNIKQIKSESNFNFLSQNNVNLIGITPLAKMFINNIQNIEDKYDILLNPNQTIFIIDNTTLNRNGTH